MLQDFVSLIFPDVCVHCREPLIKGEKQLCTGCLFDLPKTQDHLDKSSKLTLKFSSYPEVEFVYSFLKFSKKGVAQRLLHELKYKGNKEIGIMLGSWYGETLKGELNTKYDLILPVPLHSSKLRTRGYNQSDQIAQGLSEALDIPWDPHVLKRVRKTMTQTQKSKVERWKNVDQVFSVSDPSKLEGKGILLVDDVITTGATLTTCVEEIVKIKIATLGILTVARPV